MKLMPRDQEHIGSPAWHFGQRIADFFYSLLPIKEQL
jgi:hypothetical protein